ncbi:MAG TPA: M1 family metallopeptidase [Candidatus Saccharimonadia bacterium]|nr:M1 family metallopeptidase [Candidatus Saccharimonadia bacterium]
MLSVKRLYRGFRPESYTLKLSPNTNTESFTGSVVIEGLKVGPLSKRITLHQKDLKIKSSKIFYITKNDRLPIQVDRINCHKKYDEVRFHSKANLRNGKYIIELEFDGKISKNLNGIYISEYKEKNKTHKVIATQFESHHAREVFPCIDEPEAKATFDLTLIHDQKSSLISNTPILKQSTKNKLIETTFDKTPKMSVYLLAFIIGDLAYKEAITKNKTIIRSYATPANKKLLDFSLQIAVKCIDFYNEYFNIPYPLKKCDLIALPDFASGAMENWGCITFREQTLLVDPKNSSLANKQYVALVIAHELAHQWFGNLVTMRWWTDLWLNEGFASWMEFFAIDHIFPEWKLWTQFSSDEQQQAFSLDSLKDTHPVEVKVNHPDEIRTIFDAISYSKGASVINMLHKFIGQDDFKIGLRLYLKKHSHKNTTTKDLWSALEETSKKPIANFMTEWTSISGFPYVKCNVTDRDLVLTQSRFSYSKNVSYDQTWPIALISGSPNLPEIFTKSEQKFKGDFKNLKLNLGQTGFYRVIYDSDHLKSLGLKVKNKAFDEPDRLGLLSDLFEASKAGLYKTTEVVKFLSNYEDETSYSVWGVIVLIINSLRFTMDSDELRELIKPFVKKLISKELKRLGIKKIKSDNHFDRLLRPLIVSLAASSDDPKIIKFCRDQYKAILSSKHEHTVDPDFKLLIYTTVARNGDKNDFESLLKLHNESTSSEEKTNLIAAITGFKQKELITKSLDVIKSKNVRSQDISHWIAYSFSNRYAKTYTWQWLEKNWQWLEKNQGTDLSFFRMPVYAARSFTNDTYLKLYIKFFEPKITPSFKRSYLQGIELIQNNIQWRKESVDDLLDYFRLIKY